MRSLLVIPLILTLWIFHKPEIRSDSVVPNDNRIGTKVYSCERVRPVPTPAITHPYSYSYEENNHIHPIIYLYFCGSAVSKYLCGFLVYD